MTNVFWFRNTVKVLYTAPFPHAPVLQCQRSHQQEKLFCEVLQLGEAHDTPVESRWCIPADTVTVQSQSGSTTHLNFLAHKLSPQIWTISSSFSKTPAFSTEQFCPHPLYFLWKLPQENNRLLARPNLYQVSISRQMQRSGTWPSLALDTTCRPLRTSSFR